jgi:nucleoside-diphosphate-sugar epimerase
MRVLVTGAEGFVGTHLCVRLVAEGFEVRPVTRSSHGDLARIGDPDSLLEGVEALVHLANVAHRVADLGLLDAVNALGTQRLARAARRAGVRRFVYLSSAKVYGEDSGVMPYSESGAPAPLDAYGRSKLAAESALRSEYGAAGLVVLRPPLVYGPGVKANFLVLLRAVERGLPLPLASINNRRSLLGVGNLADAILACLRAPQADGRTYNVTDGAAVSTPQLVRAIAAAFGRPARLLPFPPRLLDLAGALVRHGDGVRRLTGSLTLDDTAIRRDLAWQPPQSFAAGLDQTVQWYRRVHVVAGG